MDAQDSIGIVTALIAYKDVLREIYSDLLQPGVSQVGMAIGDILEGSFLPIKEWKEKRKLLLQSRMELLRRWLAEFPEEKILSIPPELGVPVLEKLSYVQDDVISQLFLNLLATSAHPDTVNMAHPSFIRVIESLSPDEARLLFQFREKRWVIRVQEFQENTKTGDRKEFGRRYGRLERTPKLHFPQNIEVYLSNFVGLGLIERGGARLLPESLEEKEEFFDDRSYDFS